MTGAYLRAQREGKWQPVEVEHLTNQERVEQFQNRPVEEVIRWLNLTCEKLAEVQPLLEGLEADGILERK